MDKPNARLRELLDLYLSDQATAADKTELWDYVESPVHADALGDLLSDAYHREQTGLELEENEKRNLLKGIFDGSNIGISDQQVRSIWWRTAIAAAIAIMIFGAGLFYYQSQQTKQTAVSIYANDVGPGKNTATLTLANGKVINLDTNKTSVVVADSVKSITMLTASTPRGGTYQVVLPDGTKAWLNAASSIRFPSSFAGNKQRRIEMIGEVYLEVAKDKAHPFIVTSKGQHVEVLGTHFNISTYTEEGATKTTLLEGSVRINPIAITSSSLRGRTEESRSNLPGRGPSTESRAATILKPNQQAILTPDNSIKVQQVNAADAIDWKNGEFIFKNEDFHTAMRRIARWYNVDIVYQNTNPIILEPRGWVSRNSPISSVLNMIQSTGDVHFKIEGRRIIVTN